MLGGPDDCLLEIRMFKQLHGRRCSFAYHFLANRLNRSACRSQIAIAGSTSGGAVEASFGFFPSCSPIAPSIAADPRRLEWRNLEQTVESSLFRQEQSRPFDGLLRGEFACFSPDAQEVQERRVFIGEAGPCLRSSGMNDGFGADELAREAAAAGRDFASPGILCRESEEIGGGNSGRVNGLPF